MKLFQELINRLQFTSCNQLFASNLSGFKIIDKAIAFRKCL